jgi:hypothetical protein
MIDDIISIAIHLAPIAASIAFHARIRSWWTLSFLIFTLMASVWFPLEQRNPYLYMDEEVTGIARIIVDTVWWLASPALNTALLAGVSISLLGVALTVPRRNRT